MSEYKALVFDMDGTLADLYGVNGWLEYILNGDATPYEIAEPLVDLFELNQLLYKFIDKGFTITVCSWLAKNSSKGYAEKVTKAKLKWLWDSALPIKNTKILPYGTNKSKACERFGGFQVLIDDEEKNLKEWKLGTTIDAKKDIIKELQKLLDNLK